MSESKLIREALKQIFEAVPGSAGDSSGEAYLRPEPEKTKTKKELARSGPLGGSGPVSAGATSLDRDDIALRTTEMENKRKMAAQAERRAEAAGPGKSYGSVSPSPNVVKPVDQNRAGQYGNPYQPPRTKGGESDVRPMPQGPMADPNLGYSTTPVTKSTFNRPSAGQAYQPPMSKNMEVKKGDTMWGAAKTGIEQSRNLAASGPLAGTPQGRALLNQKISNRDIAARTERIKSLNPDVDPRRMRIGSTLRLEQSLLSAFDKVMSSKHPNVFQEAKNKNESIFSEAELAYFEGVGKIAGKPNDKSVPAGKDTSNATGSRSGTLSDEYVEEGRRGRPPKGESLGVNELHMNVKRALDNMRYVPHTFANGETVNITKAMAVGFSKIHGAAKTPDDKDEILRYAHSSPLAFKNVVEGKPIPKKKKKGISLAGNM